MTKKKKNDYLDIQVRPMMYSDSEYLKLTPKMVLCGRKHRVSIKGEMSEARLAMLVRAIAKVFKIKDIWKIIK